MAKYLKDVSIYLLPHSEEARRWGMCTNFLEDLYRQYLVQMKTNGVAKIAVTPVRNPVDPRIRILVNPTVLQVFRPFDFDAFWGAGDADKKRISLDLLQAGLLEVAEAKGWDSRPLIGAYNKILEADFVNERPWSKSVASRDKSLIAQIWCRYDSDKADLFFMIRRKGGRDSRAFITSVKPGDVWINDVLGKLEWISEDKVTLISKDASRTWDASAH